MWRGGASNTRLKSSNFIESIWSMGELISWKTDLATLQKYSCGQGSGETNGISRMQLW